MVALLLVLLRESHLLRNWKGSSKGILFKLLAAENHFADSHTLQHAGSAVAQDEWEAAVAITTLQRWASQ